MRLTVELTGVSKGDVALFEKLNSKTLSVNVRHYGNSAQITAFGSYDDLVNVILQTTCFKSYTIKLQ